MPSRSTHFVFFVAYHPHVIKASIRQRRKDSEYSNVTFTENDPIQKNCMFVGCIGIYAEKSNIGDLKL